MSDPMLFARVQSATGTAHAAAAFGYELPQSLVDAVEALDAAELYGNEDQSVPIHTEALTITAADVPKVLTAAVDAKLRRDAMQPLRAELVELLGRRVIREVIAAGPAMVAALAEPFLERASVFEERFRKVPGGGQDASRLVAAGPDAVAAFGEAQRLTVELDMLRGVRESLAALRIVAKGDAEVEKGTRYCRTRNTGSARRAAEALSGSHGPLGVWGDLLSADGVQGLHWLSIEEQAAYVAALPVVENRMERNGIGWVPVSA